MLAWNLGCTVWVCQFPETLEYLAELEKRYGFKTKIYYPKGYHPDAGKNEPWRDMEEAAAMQKKVRLAVAGWWWLCSWTKSPATCTQARLAGRGRLVLCVLVLCWCCVVLSGC